MTKTVKIYCEGNLSSHDYFVLTKTIENLSVTIQPIGGTRDAENAIQAFESEKPSDFYVFFRDRDFETPFTATKQETDIWTEQTFDDTLNAFYAPYEKEDFYTHSDFLIWFQGKDFAKMLSLLLIGFPMNAYFRFAKKYFDYTQFDDLVQFRKLILKHIGFVIANPRIVFDRFGVAHM